MLEAHPMPMPRADGLDEPVYTIGQLAKDFKITPRALRFYESRGLLSPGRKGGDRLYGRKEADRLAAIIKAKKFGFPLTEIRQMIGDEGSRQTLNLSHEKCLEQIAHFERKLTEIQIALVELRQLLVALPP
jgi:DNA-binding transcriptional MerR regulator